MDEVESRLISRSFLAVIRHLETETRLIRARFRYRKKLAFSPGFLDVLVAAHPLGRVGGRNIEDVLVAETGLEPVWLSSFDFKSNAYTNSATRPYKTCFLILMEAPTGIEPVYKVLQTSA